MKKNTNKIFYYISVFIFLTIIVLIVYQKTRQEIDTINNDINSRVIGMEALLSISYNSSNSTILWQCFSFLRNPLIYNFKLDTVEGVVLESGLSIKNINNQYLIKKDIVINNKGVRLAKLEYYIDIIEVTKKVLYNENQYLFLIMFLIFFVYLMAIIKGYIDKIIINKFLEPLTQNIDNIIMNPNNLKNIRINNSVVILVIDNFIKIINKYNETNKIMIQKSHLATVGQISSQVAHDIRSPLTVLNMAIMRIARSLPEYDRILLRSQIRRIQDIANDLLSKKRKLVKGESTNSEQLSVQLLSSCIDEIITEKRLQFRQYLEINIEGNLDNSYGLFAKINLVEFKRIISNLINNSIEAFSDKKGRVVIHILDVEIETLIKVLIEDNGKGIPSHIIDKIEQEGISYGKENNKVSGSGLGISHAKTTIEKWGGKFKIESTKNVGTKIFLSLPKMIPPEWFAANIEIKSDSEIVILDDDYGMHATWTEKLEKAGIYKSNIKVNHISTPNDLEKWISNIADYFKKNIAYFFDYELIGFEETGLDLIDKYKLQNAILVTSHYEEDKIQLRCKELNVKLIPKMLIGFVPINIENNTVNDETTVNKDKEMSKNAIKKTIPFDCVYIEDEFYQRQEWERTAKNKGVSLLTLSNPNEFEEYENLLSKENCVIYIDRELGDNYPKGEDFALSLYKKGFKNLYLTTNHDQGLFKHLDWLKCMEKDSPWAIDDNWK